MRPIPTGTKATASLLVGHQHLANTFKDTMLPPVFATPMMVLLMENAALNAIRQFLERGESAVGIAIEVKHLAATPVGHQVRAEAEVTAVQGRRITFRVTAWDEIEEIGRGTHERTVIDLSRFGQHLAAKSKNDG